MFNTLTGNSGGAISPTAGNINTLGTGSITVVGNAGTSTLTTQLTGLNNHAVLVGAGTPVITNLAVGTSGSVLIGATGADPAFVLLTSSDNSVLFTPGANSLSLQVNSAKVGETITGNTGPAISPVLGNWNVIGASALSGITPVTTSGGGNTLTIKVQISQAIAAADATKVGMAVFNSADFTVDATGFVSIAAGSVVLETLTGNSGGAISPTLGNINTVGTGSITIAGAGSTLTTQLTGLTNHNVLIGAGTATITNVPPSATSGIPLISQGAAVDPTFGTAVVAGGGTGAVTFTAFAPIVGGTTATNPFQSASTGIGTAGFVLTSTGAGSVPTFQNVSASGGVTSIGINSANAPGTNPTLPSAGLITITGTNVNNGTSIPVQTHAIAANAFRIEVQNAASNAGSDATKAGLASFFNQQFTVDSNGFVVTNGTGVLNTLTGNSGGALSPTAGNINVIGTGSITVVGLGSTLTAQLTGLTNHAIQIGAGTATLTQLGSGTTGQVLQTNTGADPTWSTATYPSTTTINQVLYSSAANTVAGITASNNGVLISSATGVPSWLAAGTTGQVLTATTGSPATWAAPATSGTVTSVSVVSANGFAGTVATATTTPAITLSTTITGVLSGNGTAISGSTVTQFDVLVGGASNAISSVGPGTVGQILQSGGNAANPVYSTSTYPATNAINTLLYASAANVMSALATANNGVLITSATGVPSWLPDGTTGQFLTATTGSPPTWTTVAPGGVSSVTGTANQILASPTTGAVVLTLVGPYTPATYTAHGVLVGEGTGSIVAVGPSASTGQILQNNAAADPSYSTATYPSTTTINQILYSSAANVVSGLATANGGVLDTTSTGVPQVDTTNFSVLSTGVQIKGNNANTAPPAGFIGEKINGINSAGSAMTSTVALNITSVSLTTGIWDVSGLGYFSMGTGGSLVQMAINTTTGSIAGTTAGDNLIAIQQTTATITATCPVIPSYRVTLGATTTYYLVGVATFVGAATVYGRLSATRVG